MPTKSAGETILKDEKKRLSESKIKKKLFAEYSVSEKRPEGGEDEAKGSSCKTFFAVNKIIRIFFKNSTN